MSPWNVSTVAVLLAITSCAGQESAPSIPGAHEYHLGQSRSSLPVGTPCSAIDTGTYRCVARMQTQLVYRADSLVLIMALDTVPLPSDSDMTSGWQPVYAQSVRSLGRDADSVRLASGDTAITAYWDRSMPDEGGWAATVTLTRARSRLGYGAVLLLCDSSAATMCPYWARRTREREPR
jgi:hypothetical protein